jgi:opacity protein-like surface antigen
MGRRTVAALIAVMALLFPVVAQAADFMRPLPPASAKYLRFDLGYKLYADPDAIFTGGAAFGPGYAVPGNGELFLEDMGAAWAFGIGVGYDPAGPHRFDFTLDYETPSDYYGRLDCPACGATYSEETASISAWTGLFNVYWDFDGEFHHGLKPYVGAGVGFSVLKTSNVYTSDPAGPYPGDTKVNLAWALMAGASKELKPGLSLDFNYRFLWLGTAVSGVIYDGDSDPGTLEYRHIRAHEFRVGLRHMIN